MSRKRQWQHKLPECDSKRLAGAEQEYSTEAKEFERQLMAELISSLSSPAEAWRYQTAWQDVRMALARTLRLPFNLHRFGSSAMGLAFVDSDIDLCLEVLGWKEPPSLNAVQGALRRQRSLFSHVIGVRARVPIVKFVHVRSGLSGDISFGGLLAVRNTGLLKLLCSMDTRVHPVLAFTKRWGRAQGVANTDVDRQRLSAYALALLTVFYLQKRGILPCVAALQAQSHSKVVEQGWDCSFAPIRWASRDPASLYDLVVGFFAFFAGFSFGEHVVCPLLGRPVPRSDFLMTSSLPREMAAYADRVIVPPPPEPTPTEKPAVVTDAAPGTGKKRKKKKKKNPGQAARPRAPGLEVAHHALCVQDPFVLDHNVARGQTDKAFAQFAQALATGAALCKQVPAAGLLSALLLPLVADKSQNHDWKQDPRHPQACPVPL